MGRFLQRDVNASGLLILSSLAFAGEPLEPAPDPFDPQAHYTDGLNLFAFTAADPVNSADPLGLYSHDYDPFDEVDQVIADMWAERAVAAERAFRFFDSLARSTALAAAEAFIVAMVPGGALLVSGFNAAMTLDDVLTNGLSWGNGLALAASVTGFGSEAARLLGRFNGAVGRARAAYAAGGAVRWIRHHTVPRAILRALRPAVAADPRVRGRRGAPNIWRIPEDVHKAIHRGPRGGPWNLRWWEELEKVGGAKKANADQVVAIRERLIEEFGLSEFRP